VCDKERMYERMEDTEEGERRKKRNIDRRLTIN
jgi:hypothetical protein